jgi:hypothetical protein
MVRLIEFSGKYGFAHRDIVLGRVVLLSGGVEICKNEKLIRSDIP